MDGGKVHDVREVHDVRLHARRQPCRLHFPAQLGHHPSGNVDRDHLNAPAGEEDGINPSAA